MIENLTHIANLSFLGGDACYCMWDCIELFFHKKKNFIRIKKFELAYKLKKKNYIRSHFNKKKYTLEISTKRNQNTHKRDNKKSTKGQRRHQ